MLGTMQKVSEFVNMSVTDLSDLPFFEYMLYYNVYIKGIKEADTEENRKDQAKETAKEAAKQSEKIIKSAQAQNKNK